MKVYIHTTYSEFSVFNLGT